MELLCMGWVSGVLCDDIFDTFLVVAFLPYFCRLPPPPPRPYRLSALIFPRKSRELRTAYQVRPLY